MASFSFQLAVFPTYSQENTQDDACWAARYCLKSRNHWLSLCCFWPRLSSTGHPVKSRAPWLKGKTDRWSKKPWPSLLSVTCFFPCLTQGDLVAVGVLSGNRNFEGRVHPNTRANYLASPPLVIAYAIAGTIRIDFEKEPLGKIWCVWLQFSSEFENFAGRKLLLSSVCSEG